MHRLLLPALALAVVLALLLIGKPESTITDLHSTHTPEYPEAAAATPLAWVLDDAVITPAERAVSGLQQWPETHLTRIQAPGRPRGDRLALNLGSGGQFEGPILQRTAHGNGDETVLIRVAPSQTQNEDGEPRMDPVSSQAVLTWGADGLFGRIHHGGGLFLVHSDAAGTWLVDLNDDRIRVDAFDHDILTDEARIYPEAAARKRDPSAVAADSQIQDARQLLDDDSPIVIDVLFAYTPAMAQRYPGTLLDTRLNHLVAIANQTLVDSEVPVAVRLVGQEQVNYNASSVNGITLENLQSALAGNGAAPGLETLASRRNALGADIVAFTWPHDIETRGSCGVAFFPRFDNGSYDADFGVHIDNDGFSNWSVCSDAVFTHELGHNLNAEHQRARSSGDDPDRANYAFIEIGRFHTIMGSFGTGDQDRYRRLDQFSNPLIQCGGQPCGSAQLGNGADNAGEITRMAVNVANYRSPAASAPVNRPAPSLSDRDADGQPDESDPFPFDPFDGQGNPNPEPALVFSPRQLSDAEGRSELLVVSSGSDQVLAFDTEGNFRSVAVAPQRINPGPILSDFSDLLVDDEGRITLLSSGDVRRYDRLSGQLIEVFLSSQRPEPNDLLSPFPRALTTLPNGQLIVLGDSAIERYDDRSGAPLTRLTGDPTNDPDNWNQRLELSLRSAAQWALKLYVAEASQNRILRFSAAGGAREADLVGPGNGLISDPWDLEFDRNGLLYLANGSAGNVLRFNPANNQFIDTFVPAGRGGLAFARALAFGPDGDLYVADRMQDAVLRFDGVSGEFKGFAVSPGQSGLDSPEALAFTGELNETVAGTSGHFFAPSRAGEGWLLERLNASAATVSWFTYPPIDSGQTQAWLVGVGQIENQTVRFEELLLTRGVGFGIDYDPATFETEIWGELTLEFHDCNSGVARWNGPSEWGSGEQRFDRLIEIPGLPCGSQPLEPSSQSPGISGQWFEASRSGQGWFIQEIAPDQAFIAWYSYDDDGEQIWLVGSGQIADGAVRVDDLLRPVGTAFGADFDAGDVVLEPWGSLRLTFSDCNNAVAEYSALDAAIGSGVLFPERLTRLDALDCDIP